jgi:hypothetical protein
MLIIMEQKYLAKIPFDIIINHIMPYTYNVQNKELLYDIKNFVEDLNLIENCYLFDYNYIMLYRDLVGFYEYKFNNRYCDFINEINKKYIKAVRIIWGILTPKLRTEFINKYILEDV